jgi:DNA-binding response OmpR family regulator
VRTCKDKVVAFVDDDENLTRLMCEFLESRGLEVASFNSAEALLAADATAYGVIIMDIQLPGMWGSECVYQLRNRGYNGPVIAITGYMEQWDEDDLSDLGFNRIFPKPFEPDEVIECIKECLDARSRTAE